ncbi:unnamed protein product [Pedinophyceae sp. YPF-701]|nr:unnamed protein product [Pedinophyceae sp. YPF-701]
MASVRDATSTVFGGDGRARKRIGISRSFFPTRRTTLPRSASSAAGTFYGGAPDGMDPDSPSYGTSIGSCGYQRLSRDQWPYWRVGALATSNYFFNNLAVKGCGACFEVVCQDRWPFEGRCNSDVSRRSVKIVVTDSCPECGSDHLDLQARTFEQIAPMRGGRISLSYRQVACEPDISVKLLVSAFRQGSGGWLRVALFGHGGRGTVAEIGVRGSDSEALQQMQNKWGANWEAAGWVPRAPLSFRWRTGDGFWLQADGVVSREGFTGEVDTGVQVQGTSSSSAGSYDTPPSSAASLSDFDASQYSALALGGHDGDEGDDGSGGSTGHARRWSVAGMLRAFMRRAHRGELRRIPLARFRTFASDAAAAYAGEVAGGDAAEVQALLRLPSDEEDALGPAELAPAAPADQGGESPLDGMVAGLSVVPLAVVRDDGAEVGEDYMASVAAAALLSHIAAVRETSDDAAGNATTLAPPGTSSPLAPSPAPAAPPAALFTALTALNLTKMGGVLADAGPAFWAEVGDAGPSGGATYFVPVDAAFPPDWTPPSTRLAREALLFSHVAARSRPLSELRARGRVTSLEGTAYAVHSCGTNDAPPADTGLSARADAGSQHPPHCTAGGTALVACGDGCWAEVLVPDVPVPNGVVHVVSEVLHRPWMHAVDTPPLGQASARRPCCRRRREACRRRCPCPTESQFA